MRETILHRGPATAAIVLFIVAAAVAQTRMSFADAAAVIDALASSLPPDLRGRTPAQMAALWPGWVERHDRSVRARLARGDEDSLVNFWLYGTSFTAHPPAIGRNATATAAEIDALARRRLEDFLDAVARPGGSERLRFSHQVLRSRNADPSNAAGRERARRFMLDTRRRMMNEFAATDRALGSVDAGDAGARAAANASIFRERGLSSDTSILADYGVAAALEAIRGQALLGSGSVRRAAIVGPGLDFTNKTDGYDFYPQQTIQPFALIDALRRAGLAAADLRVTTLDISERVNEHLRTAVAQTGSAAASPYILTLPLDDAEEWTADVVAYWKAFGSSIGEEVATPRPPEAAGNVRVRSINVRPDIVRSIAPVELNIVVDRMSLPAADRFDLIIATNILVYYGMFEQGLALANIAAMLRPGGLFLTNNAVFPIAPIKPTASYLRVVHTPQRYDEMFWYERQ